MTWLMLAKGEPRLGAAVPLDGVTPAEPDFSGSSRAAVLGIYAGNDDRVNASQPAARAVVEAAGMTHELQTFEGVDHAFNDTGPRYNAEGGHSGLRRDDWLVRRAPRGLNAEIAERSSDESRCCCRSACCSFVSSSEPPEARTVRPPTWRRTTMPKYVLAYHGGGTAVPRRRPSRPQVMDSVGRLVRQPRRGRRRRWQPHRRGQDRLVRRLDHRRRGRQPPQRLQPR